MTSLEKDILALSSGTVASLINDSSYTRIDDIRSDFLTFVRYRYRGSRQPWQTWIHAWFDFDAYRQRSLKPIQPQTGPRKGQAQ